MVSEHMVQRSYGSMVLWFKRLKNDSTRFQINLQLICWLRKFLSGYMWKRDLNYIFNIIVDATLKIKINIFKSFLAHIFKILFLTMTSNKDEHYVKNEDIIHVNKTYQVLLRKSRSNGDLLGFCPDFLSLLIFSLKNQTITINTWTFFGRKIKIFFHIWFILSLEEKFGDL